MNLRTNGNSLAAGIFFYFWAVGFSIAQSVSVSPQSVTLGTYNSADFLVSSPVTVHFNAGSWVSHYTLRVFTENSDGQPGLVGQSDSTFKLPFKVWTANYGPTTTVPYPDNCPNWTDYWLWVPDKSEMVSDNRYTWRRLSWVGPGEDKSVGSPFDVYFAFDLVRNGYSQQTYKTKIYFELIDKFDDDTGALSVIDTLVLDLTLNFHFDGSVSLDVGSLQTQTAMLTTDTRLLVSGTLYASIEASGLRSYNSANDYNAVSIRTYTKNNPQNSQIVQMGLPGQTNPDQAVHLKVWTPNYGTGVDNDADGIPDIDNDLNWKSDSASVWLYVFDANQTIREQAPFDYPLFDQTDLIKFTQLHPDPDQQVPPGFRYVNPSPYSSSCEDGRIPIKFCLTLDGKTAPQTYKTEIYVELAVSGNYGQTFTSITDSLELTVHVQAAQPIITLTADQTTLQFSGLQTFSHRKLADGYVTLSLDALGLYQYDALALRMLTRNGPDAQGHVRLGMLGNDRPDWSVNLRAWSKGIDDNDDNVPDINNDTNWKGGDSIVWAYILDEAEPAREDWSYITDPQDPFYDGQNAWGRPLFDFVELYRWSDYNDRTDANGDYVYHLPQHIRMIDRTQSGGLDRRVKIYFAADFTDAFPQDYNTIVNFEAAFSADGGYTIARKETLQVNISASIPGNSKNALYWMQQRVDMNPVINGSNGKVEKLADSKQEENNFNDAGYIYDQALAVIAFTRAGDYTRAAQVLNALNYLQNSDGSFFFSYMSAINDSLINVWATTDTDNNNLPDELEKRVNWWQTHNLSKDKQQVKEWIYDDWTSTACPQTETTLPDKIKYRTNDFRKFTGTNAWLALALIYYENASGDEQFRPVLDNLINYLKSLQQVSLATATDSLDYGAVRGGRSFFWWAGDSLNGYDGLSKDGFVNLRAYSMEHNLDTYAAFRYYAGLTGDQDAKDRAEEIKNFVFRALWAPGIDLTLHPEANGYVENCFFVGFDMTDNGLQQNPYGLIDVHHFLDAQSWAVLSFGQDVSVTDKNGNAGTLKMVLDFLDETDHRTWLDYNNNPISPRPFLKVTDQSIYQGTSAAANGIDGYKESARERYYQTADNPTGDFVWSEGSEGVVGARYLTGDTSVAQYYHNETNSYMLQNGGVPYSTLAVLDSAAWKGKELWLFADLASIAGTAWYFFNQPDANGDVFNPFQPFELPPEPIFTEDFESYSSGDWPDTSDWTALKASLWFWEAVNDAGSMQMEGFNGGEQLLEINGYNPGDFTLSCAIRFPSSSAHQAGLFFRKQDSNNFYTAYLEEGQSATSTWAVVFGKIQNGSFSKLDGAGIGETIATGKTYRLKVDASGSTIKIYVDKGNGFDLIIQKTDNTFSTGTLGLRGNAAGHTRWDNIILYDVAGVDLNKRRAAQGNDTKKNHLPTNYALLPNFPNPFNMQTNIRFTIPETQKLHLQIYDSCGRLVTTLMNKTLQAGRYTKSWDGLNNNHAQVSSGMYFIRMRAGNFVAYRKALLLK